MIEESLLNKSFKLNRSMRCLNYSHLFCQGISLESFDTLTVTSLKEEKGWRDVLNEKRYIVIAKLSKTGTKGEVYLNIPQKFLQKIIQQQP